MKILFVVIILGIIIMLGLCIWDSDYIASKPRCVWCENILTEKGTQLPIEVDGKTIQTWSCNSCWSNLWLWSGMALDKIRTGYEIVDGERIDWICGVIKENRL